MKKFDLPTYVLDMKDENIKTNVINCKMDNEFDVLVCLESNDNEKSIPAKCRRIVNSGDDIFRITVKTVNGIQHFDWTYSFLLAAVA